MAIITVFDDKGNQIPLIPSGKGGGEGAIYVNHVKKGECAKLYFPNKVTKELQEKIAAMVGNYPEDPTWTTKKHRSIAWPSSCLFSDRQKNKFIGFSMPFIDTKIFQESHRYYSSKDRKQQFLGSFNWQYLMASASNIASAIASIHKKGHCIGDLRETNILIAKSSLITIVDCDSFQIKHKDTGKCFFTRVGTGEYLPPELFGADFKARNYNRYYSDLFAMAVLIFKLLMNGFHPFSSKGSRVDDAPSIEAKILKGYFAYSGKISGVEQPFDTFSFEILPSSIQELFLKCFEDGHRKPEERPLAREWLISLRDEYLKLITCVDNSNHKYSPHLKYCPWCYILGSTGKDPFPEPIGDQISIEDPNGSLDTIDKRLAHIQSFISMALADGALTEEEKDYIFDKASKLQVPEKEVKLLLDKELKGLAIFFPGVPVLELSKSSIDFNDINLGSMPSSSLIVKNGGGGSLEAQIKTDKPWLIVSHNKIHQKDLPLPIAITIDTDKDKRCDLGFRDIGYIEISYKKAGTIDTVRIPVNLSIKTDVDASKRLIDRSMIISMAICTIAAILSVGKQRYSSNGILLLVLAAIFGIAFLNKFINKKYGLAILWSCIASVLIADVNTNLFLCILPIPITLIFSTIYFKRNPKKKIISIVFPLSACLFFLGGPLLINQLIQNMNNNVVETGLDNPIDKSGGEWNNDQKALLEIKNAKPYEYECDLTEVDKQIRLYKKFLEQFPNSQYLPEALMALAWHHLYTIQCNETQNPNGRLAQAISYYKLLISNNSGQTWIKEARELLEFVAKNRKWIPYKDSELLAKTFNLHANLLRRITGEKDNVNGAMQISESVSARQIEALESKNIFLLVEQSDNLNYCNPSWSQDGNKLIFNSNYYKKALLEANSGNANTYDQERGDIYEISIEEKVPRMIWSVNGRRDRKPHWSPDGQLIAFSRMYSNGIYDNGELMACEIHCPERLFISDRSNQKEINTQEIYDFCWSPNGDFILYITGFIDNARGIPRIWLKDILNEQNHLLSDEQAYNASIFYAPCWSPDGSAIAYVRYVNDTMKYYLVIINIRGEVIKTIELPNYYNGSLSRVNPKYLDEETIAVPVGENMIAILSIKDNEIVTIIETRNKAKLAYIIDISNVLFIDSGNIWLMNYDRSKKVQLTQSGYFTNAVNFSVSPLKNEIAFENNGSIWCVSIK